MKRYYWLPLCFLLTVAAAAQSTERVRIAVAGLFHSREFVLETSPSQPLIIGFEGRQEVLGQSYTESIAITRAADKIRIHNRRIDATASSFTFAGKSEDAEFTLSVPGRFRRRYRGSLTIGIGGRELVPVVAMDIETAVASVVAAEATPTTPFEALKALAVASRSYMVAGGHRHANADFCDTTHCQFLRNPPAADSPASRAAAETRGLVLMFSERPLAAMYSASCGGRTHSLAELGLPSSVYPYFGVECPYCRSHPDRWSARIAEADAASASSGERGRLELARRLGWNVVPSNNFAGAHTESGVLLSGAGHGHGLGLCQRGAAAMAKDGRDFRAILAHYYPNTTVDSIRR